MAKSTRTSTGNTREVRSALTAKTEVFCREYLIDLNATQAAIRAGYSAKTAYSIGQRLLKNVEITNRIAELQQARQERVRIDADYVLKQAVKLHERCMQEVVPFTDRRGEQLHDESGRPLFVFDAKGAAAALALVGKHINVQAFKEQKEISGNLNIGMADSVRAAREARK